MGFPEIEEKRSREFDPEEVGIKNIIKNEFSNTCQNTEVATLQFVAECCNFFERISQFLLRSVMTVRLKKS